MPRKVKEEYDNSFLQGKKRKRGSKKTLIFIVLVLGIVIGVVLGHYFIEPLVGQVFSKYASCESKVDLLEAQVDACITEKTNCLSAREECEQTA